MQEVIDQFLRSFEESRQYQTTFPKAVIRKDGQADIASQIENIPIGCTSTTAKENDLYQVSQFLDQLRYPGMSDRHERITEAHKKTFEWIYQDSDVLRGPGAGFVNWLESGVGPYW